MMVKATAEPDVEDDQNEVCALTLLSVSLRRRAIWMTETELSRRQFKFRAEDVRVTIASNESDPRG